MTCKNEKILPLLSTKMENDRTILHCDLNGFYASVEELTHPEVRGKPMAVGGDPKSRKGIILAKNELAKKYGVSTGETIWQAKRKCPELIVLPSHHDVYEIYSQKVNKIYYRFTDRVEPFGIDESWLDVTSSKRLFGSGKEIADKIRELVKKELGLTVSVGVSFNKVFAKLGSDYKKPDATTVFDRSVVESIIYKLPAKDLLFVGRNTAEALRKMRIFTIGDIAQTDEKLLRQRFGKFGTELSQYARGEDDSPVDFYGNEENAKSIGNSMTFKRDLIGEQDFNSGYCKVAEKVARRLKDAKLKCSNLSITIKSTDFSTITRQKTLSSPTNSYKKLVEVAMELTKKNWNFLTPVRMLGIAGSKLVNADCVYIQTDLFETPKNESSEDAENVMFLLKNKFGKDSIKFGNMIDTDL